MSPCGGEQVCPFCGELPVAEAAGQQLPQAVTHLVRGQDDANIFYLAQRVCP